MNNLEKRIEKLEEHSRINEQEEVTLVVVTGELNMGATPEEIETFKKQGDAKVEAAIAEYRATHPECSEQRILIISVPNEEGKDLLAGLRERLQPNS